MRLHEWEDVEVNVLAVCRVCGQTTNACTALCPGEPVGRHPLDTSAATPRAGDPAERTNSAGPR